jgi:hypothetical protein
MLFSDSCLPSPLFMSRSRQGTTLIDFLFFLTEECPFLVQISLRNQLMLKISLSSLLIFLWPTMSATRPRARWTLLHNLSSWHSYNFQIEGRGCRMFIEPMISPDSIVVILSYPSKDRVTKLFCKTDMELIVPLWMFLFHIIFNLPVLSFSWL